MTKEKLIEELHSRGEMWANMSYKKKELEEYLKEYDYCRTLSADELYKMIMAKKEEE